MNNSIFHIILAAGFSVSAFGQSPAFAGRKNAPDEVRQIRLIQDDAQTGITSKIYELKYVKATDIRPFVENAVKRYDSQSRVERVNYFSAKKNWLIVSSGPEIIPLIDDLIAKIDQPGKLDEFGSVIEGTGVTRISYTPRYRAAQDIVNIINGALRTGIGAAYLNAETNTIYWKDDVASAKAILAWVQRLDRPVPQVNLRLNNYEVRESTLRDIGVDYLAWKNGPGLNLFAAGYDVGKIFSNEAVLQLLNGAKQFADLAKNFSTNWSYGGFFTAPQFDLSFVRLLQQSGNARLVSNADLTFLNTPLYGDGSDVTRTYYAELTPSYQNLKKDDDDRTDVVADQNGTPAVALKITNPVICFGTQTGEVDSVGMVPATGDFYENNRTGGVIFSYNLGVNSVVERNNRGDELSNYARIDGALTLGFKQEKLLGSYVKETDVEQTIGIPFLSRIPVLKYLFGTTTTLKEKSYIIVTAEARLVHPELLPAPPVSPEVVAEELN